MRENVSSANQFSGANFILFHAPRMNNGNVVCHPFSPALEVFRRAPCLHTALHGKRYAFQHLSEHTGFHYSSAVLHTRVQV